MAAAEKTRKVDVQLPFMVWDVRSIARDALSIMMLPYVIAAFYTFAAIETFYELLAYVRSLLDTAPSKGAAPLAGELEVDEFDPDKLTAADWARIKRDYIEKVVPFVLRREGGKPLSDVAPPPEAVAAAFSQGCIRVVSNPYFIPLGPLDEYIGKLFPGQLRAYWPLWFLGKYSQGLAHVDLGPATYNCYYMKSGGKDVIIVPPDVTRQQTLQNGIDGIYIPDTQGEKREYLKTLHHYYHVNLKPQSMLVFSNSACIHQFRNIDAEDGTPPEALSIRMMHPRFGDRRCVHLGAARLTRESVPV